MAESADVVNEVDVQVACRAGELAANQGGAHGHALQPVLGTLLAQ